MPRVATIEVVLEFKPNENTSVLELETFQAEVLQEYNTMFPAAVRNLWHVIDTRTCMPEVTALGLDAIVTQHLHDTDTSGTSFTVQPLQMAYGSRCIPCGERCHICSSDVDTVATNGTPGKLQLLHTYGVGTITLAYEMHEAMFNGG